MNWELGSGEKGEGSGVHLNNIIVGANCIRPLLITAAAHLYVRENHKYKMHPISELKTQI